MIFLTCSTCEIAVDVFPFPDGQEHFEDEVHGGLLVLDGAVEVGEEVHKVGVLDLLGQEILLVQKQNYRGMLEPLVVNDGLEMESDQVILSYLVCMVTEPASLA